MAVSLSGARRDTDYPDGCDLDRKGYPRLSHNRVFVSLVVASIVVYILNQAREIEVQANALLQEAKKSLEDKVDARTSDLVLANEKLLEEVSERIKAEAAIKESERRYRDLFNTISDLIMIHDLKGRLLNVNPAVSKLCGYTSNEMVGRPISDFIAPKFRSRFQHEYLRRIKKQKQFWLYPALATSKAPVTLHR